MAHRIFVGTEWTAEPWNPGSELMWVGLAGEQGRSWYGISSEAAVDPSTNAFVSGAFQLIRPDEPRSSRGELAEAVVSFCGQADEFWALIPTQERFAEWNHQLFDLVHRAGGAGDA